MSGDSRATACRKTSVTCLVLRRLQHIVESDLGRGGHRCEAIHVELFVQVETEQLWRILKRDRNLQRIIQTGHAFVDEHIGKNVWLKRRHNQRDCFRADTPGFQTYLLCAGTSSKPLSNLDELSRLNSNCTLAFSIQNLHIGKWLEVLPGVAKESEVESQNLLVTIHAGGHIRRCGLAALIVKHEGNGSVSRSEEHTSELQSRPHLLCRLLLENTTTT